MWSGAVGTPSVLYLGENALHIYFEHLVINQVIAFFRRHPAPSCPQALLSEGTEFPGAEGWENEWERTT
jgi:hypothetical protein